MTLISDNYTGPLPPAQPKEVTRRPNLRFEYVAGGQNVWLASLYRTLPKYIDDLTRDFGEDLYERMMLDPQINSCVSLLKLGILAQGVSIAPSVKEGQPGYEQSKTFAEFGTRLIGRLRGFRSRTLWNMLDCIHLGNKVAEQTYVDCERGPDRGKLVLRSVKVKPRKALAFLVGPWMDLAGFLVIVPGQAPNIIGGSLVGDINKIGNLLPASKFAVLTWQEKDEDPRGQSGLRCVYDPWFDKVAARPEHMKFLARFGSPSLVGTAAENALDVQAIGKDGLPVTDSDGAPVMVTPTQYLLTSLLDFMNGTVIALPFGSEVKALEASNEGAPFTTATDLFDRQIAKGILGSTLATEEGKHQARAAAETHEKPIGLRVQYGRTLTEEMIRFDMLARALEYNFPDYEEELLPVVSLGDLQEQDFGVMAAGVAALETSGFIEPSQRQAIDSMIGIQPRSPEEVERAEKAAKAATEQAINPPEPGQPGGNGGPPGQAGGAAKNGKGGGE